MKAFNDLARREGTAVAFAAFAAKESAIKAFQQVCRKYPKDRHASVAHAHLQNAYKISVTLGGSKDD